MSVFSQRRRACLVTLAATAFVPTLIPNFARAVSFADATGDNYGPAYVDIASVDVTSDATNLTFKINLNPSANLLASDGSEIYGKYQIGFQTGEAGNTALTNPFGNAIGISGGTGMDYWVGSWANNSATPPFSGGAALFQYTGSTATQVAGIGYSGTPFIDVPVTLDATSTTIVVPLAQLGLAQGDTFKFDVWTTFDNPSGQSAYDALGKQTQTTAPGTPYPSPVTPYDSSTTLLTYTVGGTATPVIAAWIPSGGGSWASAANWSGGVVPNGAGHEADFSGTISAPSTVTLDGDKTVGTLTFNSVNAYTLAGNTLTIDAATGNGAINVQSGSHTISSHLLLADNTTVNVALGGSTLAMTGQLTAAGKTITKTGGGTATFSAIRGAALDIQAGSVRVPTPLVAVVGAGTSVLTNLTIATGATLDLTTNALVIDYSGAAGTLPQEVRAMLESGRLIATGLPGSNRRIGYIDNAVGTPRGSFGGVDVDASSLLIQFTRAGDANLNGSVGFDDLVALAQNYNVQTGGTWQRGDFNYDAKVTFDDLVLLAQNYNSSASFDAGEFGGAFAADWALAQSLVPEPTSLAIIGVATMLMARRRTR